MTETEELEIINAVIAQLRSEGVNVATASIVDDLEDVSYVLCYDTDGNEIRVSPNTINKQEEANKSAIENEVIRAKEAEQAEVVRATNAEEELLARMQGMSDDSNPRTDSFKYLGNFDNINGDDLKATLDALHTTKASDNIEGFWRAFLGNGILEIQCIALHYATDRWIQVLKSPYRWFKNTGKFDILQNPRYRTLYRIFENPNGENSTENNVWSDWIDVEQELEDATKANSTAIAQLFETVTWDTSSNLNNFINAGVYNIKGTRQNAADGLPITNTGEDATIAARLIVTVTPEGATTYRHSVGQTLILSNAVGKETKVYTRNGNRTSTDGGVSYTITWGDWSNLQTNINVGQVDNLDNLTDNGIYSGVWTKGSYNAYPLTFVCIVINDYFVGVTPRRISQFVYGLSKMDGSVVYQSRVWDDSKSKWGDWEILNKDAISSMIGNEIRNIPAATTESAGVMSANDKQKLEASAESFEFFAEKERVGLEISANSGNLSETYIPAATAEKAGVMSAEDKKSLDNSVFKISDLENTFEKNILSIEIDSTTGEIASVTGEESVYTDIYVEEKTGEITTTINY